MAQLTDLKSLTPKQAKVLAGGGWTVDRLATADITRLTVYPGIDDVKAQRIIGEARQLVNEQGYQDALAADSWRFQGSSPDQPEPPKYSVRVQRITLALATQRSAAQAAASVERKARGEL